MLILIKERPSLVCSFFSCCRCPWCFIEWKEDLPAFAANLGFTGDQDFLVLEKSCIFDICFIFVNVTTVGLAVQISDVCRLNGMSIRLHECFAAQTRRPYCVDGAQSYTGAPWHAVKLNAQAARKPKPDKYHGCDQTEGESCVHTKRAVRVSSICKDMVRLRHSKKMCQA